MVKMTVPAMVVISFAVAGLFMSGSGFNDWAGVHYDVGLDAAGDDLRAQGAENVDGSFISGALNLLGLAISGISIIIETFVWVYLFPFALANIGFPWWFAYPLGLPVTYVNVIGTVEILRGMNIV